MRRLMKKLYEFLEKYQTAIGITLIAIILISGGILLFARAQGQKSDVKILENSESSIKVDVEGAVKNPGLYTMKQGDRVDDAIKAAGGTTDNADLSKLDKGLASKLTDGERILVPLKGESALGTTTTSSSSSSSQQQGKININTASLSDLDKLPGVGPATAQKIIDYRTQKGTFGSIEEIKEVNGIGEAKYNKLKDLITI